MFVNGLGALATGITLLVIVCAKFVEGAWITVFAIPALLLLMYSVRHHYDKIARQLASPGPLDLTDVPRPVVVLPIVRWGSLSKAAFKIAFSMSEDIRAIYIAAEGEDHDGFEKNWHENVVEPAKAANRTVPQLTIIDSPYRFVIFPIVDYVLAVAKENHDRRVIAIVPELVERRWYNYFLHSQRATLIKTSLLVRGTNRISVLNVPWYVN
jgi:hypothetical protein